MPGTVTRRFRIHNAQQFHEAFSEAAPTQMYLFIGRVDSFPDDNNPPTPPDSIQETEFNQWRNMLAAKRVQTSDISFSLARYNWSTGKYIDSLIQLQTHCMILLLDRTLCM